MEKTFCPSNYEKRIYDNWLSKDYFKAKVNKDKKPFTIVMPPPNITAKLHIGHAYTTTLQDTIIRYKRMKGFEALLIPGTDHAALATEVKVVEKLKSQGIKKEDLGREKFLEEMQKWYDEYGNQIISQFKTMGVSADWDRLAFTLDEKRCKSVRQAFVNLYNKGLIYQGKRIANWCVNCKTALSDIEVEYEAHDGKIYYINYPFEEDSSKHITVATTRPETLMGDVAVAVNPNDERYKRMIGKNLVLPIIGRKIPIIADNYVDKSFGTGMVKITPAHDPNDFEVGLRHNLQVINLLNSDGTMNENAGKFVGHDRDVCREKVVEEVKALGLLEKVENHKNNVGHCCRCHTVVEPVVTKQWYVKMKSLAKPAIDVVKSNEIKFIPKRFENLYLSWMENINDWCISRQIWSGHRIPVFTCVDCGKQIVELEDPTVCPHCGSNHLVQDEDSLDTWFSSALWPFSTLDWPNETEDFKYFYPTNLMVTAYDIIFFWVARMIFSGIEYTGKIPFSEVLIHGLVRDSQGRKMSKSLGNGVDPVDMIDKYGTDALRYSLVMGTGIGQDGKFGIEKIETARNFLNKLWNASRFVIENTANFDYEQKSISDLKLTVDDKWILTELEIAIKQITKSFDKYDLSVVASTLYDFIWNKFCDWYIEASKIRLYSDDHDEKNGVLVVLNFVLDKILKLMHPICPFMTEEIYLSLACHDETIMKSDYPEYDKSMEYTKDHKNMESIMQCIKNVRNVRAEMNVADNVKTNIFVVAVNNESLISRNLEMIKRLSMGKEIVLIAEQDVPDNCVMAVSEIIKMYIPTGDMIDREKELQRLNNELSKTENEIKRANGMLNNAGFVKNAPPSLIDSEKQKLVKYNELRETLIRSIEKLK